MASEDFVSDLYPELEAYRKKARRSRQVALDSMREVMGDMFGGLSETLDQIQTPSNLKSTARTSANSPQKNSHTVSHNQPDGLTYRLTDGETEGLTDGETEGLTNSETVPQSETHSDTVSQTKAKTVCETVRQIHPHKLRFLQFILTCREQGKPWRFTVKEASEAIGIKYVTARNYPKFCADRGWIKYRVIKSAAWQGIEVDWIDRNVEEHLGLSPVSPCETAKKLDTVLHGETVHDTISPCKTVSTPSLDRQIENLSICPETLSLSENDIAFFWPALANINFGIDQIKGICERLEKIGKNSDRLIESFHFIEHELNAGTLTAAGGKPIENPLGYIFMALAKTGYWRRPKNYISPEEQAELDKSEEARRILRAREEREEVEFKVWRTELTPDEQQKIIKGKQGPVDVWLKEYWRKNVKATTESE